MKEMLETHHLYFLSANSNLPLLSKSRSVAFRVTQSKLIINAEKNTVRDGESEDCPPKENVVRTKYKAFLGS